MIDNFFHLGLLGSAPAVLNAVILGFALGWCLEQSGLNSGKRLSGIFHFSDMTAVKILGSAVLTALLLISVGIRFGFLSSEKMLFPDSVIWAQAIGGVIFGLSLAMSGWTPGSAVAGAASGKVDAAVFLISLICGLFTFKETFKYHGFIFNLGDPDQSFLWQIIGTEPGVTVFVTAALILCLIWTVELVCNSFSFSKTEDRGRGLLIFSMLSMILAGALLMPMPERKGVAESPESESNSIADQEKDLSLKELSKDNTNVQFMYISPKNFAREKIQGLKHIAAVDIRTRSEFNTWHINGSSNFPIDAIALSLDRFRTFDRIVLIGSKEDGEEAFNILSNSKFNNVYILEGGIDKFKKDVIDPYLNLNNLGEEEKKEVEKWHLYFSTSANAASEADPINLKSLIGQ